jgi:hypothetical protein
VDAIAAVRGRIQGGCRHVSIVAAAKERQDDKPIGEDFVWRHGAPVLAHRVPLGFSSVFRPRFVNELWLKSPTDASLPTFLRLVCLALGIPRCQNASVTSMPSIPFLRLFAGRDNRPGPAL